MPPLLLALAIVQAVAPSGADSPLGLVFAVVAILLSPAVLLAFIRAAVLFGEMKKTIESFPPALDRLSTTLDGVAATIGDHNTRIAVAEATIEGIERRERARASATVGTLDRRSST